MNFNDYSAGLELALQMADAERVEVVSHEDRVYNTALTDLQVSIRMKLTELIMDTLDKQG